MAQALQVKEKCKMSVNMFAGWGEFKRNRACLEPYSSCGCFPFFVWVVRTSLQALLFFFFIYFPWWWPLPQFAFFDNIRIQEECLAFRVWKRCGFQLLLFIFILYCDWTQAVEKLGASLKQYLEAIALCSPYPNASEMHFMLWKQGS